MADGCDCQISYDVIECHLRQLKADGSPNLTPGTWEKSDSIIDFDISPEVEEGTKKMCMQMFPDDYLSSFQYPTSM